MEDEEFYDEEPQSEPQPEDGGEEDGYVEESAPADDYSAGVPSSNSVQVGPRIINFDVDNPRKSAAQNARERFAYNEALGINAAGLTDAALDRSAAITQQMRDPRLSSRDLSKLHQELQSLDVGYSPQQIQRIQGLNQQQSVLDERLASGDLDEQQHMTASGMLQTMIGAIKPQRIPQKKSPWPKGQGIGDEWTSNTGDLVTRDDKGTVKVLTKYPMTPKGLEEKYFFDAYNSALKLTRTTEDGDKVHLSPEEAATYATKSLETWKKIQQERQTIRGDAQAPPQPPAAKPITQGPPDESKQLREQLTKAMGGRKISQIQNPVERQRLTAMYQKLKQLEQR